MPAHTVYDHVCSLLGPICHRPVQVVPTRSYPGQPWRGVVVIVVEGLSSQNTLALRNPLSALTPQTLELRSITFSDSLLHQTKRTLVTNFN